MEQGGTIEIKIEGISFEQIERLRQAIHLIIQEGALSIKNGSSTLHFDGDGELGYIEFHIKKWSRKKSGSELLQSKLKSAIIELKEPQPQTKSRRV